MKKTGFLISFFLYFFALATSFAETWDNGTPHENIQIIVTSSSITVDTNFAGRDLYIAGVLENADPYLRRQGRYDVIVVMEGPIKPMIMREKKRKAGVWVNAEGMTFSNVPLFYAMATTRQTRDITNPLIYKRLGLGLNDLPLRSDSTDAAQVDEFRKQLIELKTAQHLYSENIGAVTFGSASLFTAKFQLPTNVPVGHHTVHAYLFRDGEFIETVSTQLEIAKAHIAHTIYTEAHIHSFWYGVIAVLVAIGTGFLGRFIFRRD